MHESITPVLWLTSDALNSISETMRAADPTLETGGALFGIDGEAYVAHATGPGPNAVHERSRFTRDLRFTTEIAAKLWAQDRSQWVGEWHSHPRGPAQPSDLDLATYGRHLADPALRFRQFLALIVHPTNCSLELSAWIVEGVDDELAIASAAPIRLLSSRRIR